GVDDSAVGFRRIVVWRADQHVEEAVAVDVDPPGDRLAEIRIGIPVVSGDLAAGLAALDEEVAHTRVAGDAEVRRADDEVLAAVAVDVADPGDGRPEPAARARPLDGVVESLRARRGAGASHEDQGERERVADRERS